jgi:hypothetical protein
MTGMQQGVQSRNVITSELSASTTRSAAPSPVPAVDVVSRAQGGPFAAAPIERADRELPVGCESVLGSFTRSPLTHVARDCLS